jgi:hypothetical protein
MGGSRPRDQAAENRLNRRFHLWLAVYDCLGFFSCIPKTPNIQPSTPNIEVASTFGVECSMLNVSGLESSNQACSISASPNPLRHQFAR